MKKVISFSFIAFALSLGLGIPGQARAANGGCGGRTMIHRKIKTGDTLSAIALNEYGNGTRPYYERIALANGIQNPDFIYGDDWLVIPCPENAKQSAENDIQQSSLQFAVPRVLAAVRQVKMATMDDPPEMPMAVVSNEVALPIFADMKPTFDKPAEPTRPEVPASKPNVPAPSVPAQLKVAAKPAAAPMALSGTVQRTRRTYVVALNIPGATAKSNGIVPGTFPAVYLENQKKDGEWGKRHKTVAVVNETAGGYVSRLFLNRAPARNSAVAIDFENGNSIEVASDLLKGVTVETVIPPTPKKKRYKALAAAYRVKTPFLLAALRFTAPTLAQGGMGFVTMGPLGLAMAPVSLVENLAMKKIAGNQRTMAAAEHPSLHVDYLLADQGEKIGAQDTRIRTLEFEIQSLQKQMDSLRQTATNPNPTSRRSK